ncbi:hypothetical protein BKA69DRAFT_323388 [Paraphysoderma sedebokerense]|nr:hypothetical protein BKA69DRAFT_323388 [Paraphysoderma sedebokerense]
MSDSADGPSDGVSTPAGESLSNSSHPVSLEISTTQEDRTQCQDDSIEYANIELAFKRGLEVEDSLLSETETQDMTNANVDGGRAKDIPLISQDDSNLLGSPSIKTDLTDISLKESSNTATEKEESSDSDDDIPQSLSISTQNAQISQKPRPQKRIDYDSDDDEQLPELSQVFQKFQESDDEGESNPTDQSVPKADDVEGGDTESSPKNDDNEISQPPSGRKKRVTKADILERKKQSERLIRSSRLTLENKYKKKSFASFLGDYIQKPCPKNKAQSNVTARAAESTMQPTFREKPTSPMKSDVIYLSDSDSDESGFEDETSKARSPGRESPLKNGPISVFNPNQPHITTKEMNKNLQLRIAQQSIMKRKKMEEKARAQGFWTEPKGETVQFPEIKIDIEKLKQEEDNAEAMADDEEDDPEDGDFKWNSDEEFHSDMEEDMLRGSEDENVSKTNPEESDSENVNSEKIAESFPDNEEQAKHTSVATSNIGLSPTEVTESPSCISDLPTLPVQDDEEDDGPSFLSNKRSGVGKRKLQRIIEDEDADDMSKDGLPNKPEGLKKAKVDSLDLYEELSFSALPLSNEEAPGGFDFIDQSIQQNALLQIPLRSQLINQDMEGISMSQTDSTGQSTASGPFESTQVDDDSFNQSQRYQQDSPIGYITKDGLLSTQLPAQSSQLTQIRRPSFSFGLTPPENAPNLQTDSVQAAATNQIRRPRFIESEAQESDDEFRGAGGEDGENSDDDATDDEIVAADNPEEAAQGVEEVRALVQQQEIDTDAKDVEAIKKGLLTGGLGLNRRTRMDLSGKGYGLDDYEEGYGGYGDDNRNRFGRKKRMQFSSALEKIADKPETAAFAKAFVDDGGIDDTFGEEVVESIAQDIEGIGNRMKTEIEEHRIEALAAGKGNIVEQMMYEEYEEETFYSETHKVHISKPIFNKTSVKDYSLSEELDSQNNAQILPPTQASMIRIEKKKSVMKRGSLLTKQSSTLIERYASKGHEHKSDLGSQSKNHSKEGMKTKGFTTKLKENADEIPLKPKAAEKKKKEIKPIERKNSRLMNILGRR